MYARRACGAVAVRRGSRTCIAGRVARDAVLALALVVGVVAPFIAVVALPVGSAALSWVLALSALVYMVGVPALVVVVARSVMREARDARASAEALGAELGWERATRGSRPAFVGMHRGRAAYVMSTVRMDPSNDAGRKRFRARPVLRVGFDEAPWPGAAEGVDLPPRGVSVDDARRALDAVMDGASDGVSGAW